jgi:hypothetical protein
MEVENAKPFHGHAWHVRKSGGKSNLGDIKSNLLDIKLEECKGIIKKPNERLDAMSSVFWSFGELYVGTRFLRV